MCNFQAIKKPTSQTFTLKLLHDIQRVIIVNATNEIVLVNVKSVKNESENTIIIKMITHKNTLQKLNSNQTRIQMLYLLLEKGKMRFFCEVEYFSEGREKQRKSNKTHK